MGTGGGLERRKTETTQDEEESTTSSPHTRTKQPTNPYGYLLNEFSEADSGEERGECEALIGSCACTNTSCFD